VDQATASAPVAVRERVDGLELSVCDCRLGHGWRRVGVTERTQVFEEIANELGRWRHERRRAGVVAAAADPVLLRPDHARVRVQPGAGQQPPVEPQQVLHRDRIAGTDAQDRRRHRVDVGEHLGGGDVGRRLTQFDRRLGPQQSPRAHFQALDPGGRDALGPQQDPGQGLGVQQRSGLRVQGRDGPLRVGHVRRRLAAVAEGAPGQRVGHVGLVVARLPVAACDSRSWVTDPAAPDNLRHLPSLLKVII
jgi:hypothetical protein